MMAEQTTPTAPDTNLQPLNYGDGPSSSGAATAKIRKSVSSRMMSVLPGKTKTGRLSQEQAGVAGLLGMLGGAGGAGAGGAPGGGGLGGLLAGMDPLDILRGMLQSPGRTKATQGVILLVYMVIISRDIRVFLYWFSSVEFMLTFLAFVYQYPIFLTSGSYNLIWLTILHIPKAILGILIAFRMPRVEDMVEPMLGTFQGSLMEVDTREKNYENDITAYLKMKIKTMSVPLILYGVLLALCLAFDFLAHVILMFFQLGDDYQLTIPAYSSINFITSMYFISDVFVLFLPAGFVVGLPSIVQTGTMKVIKALFAAVFKSAKSSGNKSESDDDVEAAQAQEDE